ncbi:hypothetical protein D3C81_1555300 [compost metagenome]
MLQECLPGFTQGHAARAAIQQAGLQALLKAGDLPAYVRRRYAHALGCGRELARFGHGYEFIDTLPAAGH